MLTVHVHVTCRSYDIIIIMVSLLAQYRTEFSCTLKLNCFCLLLCLTVTKENPSGAPNLEVWTSEKVAEFVQKKYQEWYGTLLIVCCTQCAFLTWHCWCSRSPQWSDDEQLCARNVTNEVHCFEGGLPGDLQCTGIDVITDFSWIEGMHCF